MSIHYVYQHIRDRLAELKKTEKFEALATLYHPPFSNSPVVLNPRAQSGRRVRPVLPPPPDTDEASHVGSESDGSPSSKVLYVVTIENMFCREHVL